jgi:pilus assembly protein CpaF
LRAIVAARLNFLVSGGTGSGKTTLLGAMLSAADPAERLLLVEDAQELAPEHPHVVGIQCRTGNIEGAGQVTLTDLVRQALRMRPDRLVVGECRGAEVREFLGAMNTGHDGAGGTIHASSAGAVPARLAAMGALAGMGPEAVALQAASALDLVVHMARPGGRRMPVEIGRLIHRSDAAGGRAEEGEGRGAGPEAGHGPGGAGLAVVTVARRTPEGRLGLGPAAGWFRHSLAERSIPPPW